ncbi:MAG: peptide chain release factor N(5)-glutamine methyltransferase [Parerythrobacter sp.]
MEVTVAIREATATLSQTSDTARLDAELLMARALQVSRSAMLLGHMRDAVPPAFGAMLERRAGGEPVAYILGEQEFYGRPLSVSPAVLIPRGDSETAVAAAMEHTGEAGTLLDCGTGSGALLLTLLAERTGWTGTGIDASAAALDVARRNAVALGLAERTILAQRDWTQDGWRDGLGRFDLVIANPPYVENDAALDRSVRDYEPGAALFAGADGLDDYRVLVPQLPTLLAPGGVTVLEIGATQDDSVAALARDSGFATALRRDLAGRPRALILTAS